MSATTSKYHLVTVLLFVSFIVLLSSKSEAQQMGWYGIAYGDSKCVVLPNSMGFTLVELYSGVPIKRADWLFGPDNFEECIGKYQKQAASEMAARAIHMACDKKFVQKVDERYADCVLKHVVNTRSDLGVRAIIGACSNLYISNEDIEYSRCILKNMPGVEVDIAARSIATSCRR